MVVCEFVDGPSGGRGLLPGGAAQDKEAIGDFSLPLCILPLLLSIFGFLLLQSVTSATTPSKWISKQACVPFLLFAVSPSPLKIKL